ncbi:hypothetical protein ADUPG1_007862 [Aduncisulcus paluster]|uniref:Pseudouridine synthase RsuA/RluA-like domain-containing protein n=1 Tax=Aduncisulcus paluster TaxID=2918883 RepID=A0ABQ5KPV5_9EUKA|nr:hypothetical protein ADUPG1_007862 [Aduncisulcus paluster]
MESIEKKRYSKEELDHQLKKKPLCGVSPILEDKTFPIYKKYDEFTCFKPYHHRFTVFTKRRWIGKTILDVFLEEFSMYSKEYYKNAILFGRIRVSGHKVPTDYVFTTDNVLVSHLIHKHEPPATKLPSIIFYEKKYDSKSEDERIKKEKKKNVELKRLIQHMNKAIKKSLNRVETLKQIKAKTVEDERRLIKMEAKLARTRSEAEALPSLPDPINFDSYVPEKSMFFAANKPSAMPTHSCGRYNFNSLHSWCENELGEKLYICHRLDKLTSGCVVFGRTAHAADSFHQLLKRHRCRKVYVCKVWGNPMAICGLSQHSIISLWGSKSINWLKEVNTAIYDPMVYLGEEEEKEKEIEKWTYVGEEWINLPSYLPSILISTPLSIIHTDRKCEVICVGSRPHLQGWKKTLVQGQKTLSVPILDVEKKSIDTNINLSIPKSYPFISMLPCTSSGLKAFDLSSLPSSSGRDVCRVDTSGEKYQEKRGKDSRGQLLKDEEKVSVTIFKCLAVCVRQEKRVIQCCASGKLITQHRVFISSSQCVCMPITGRTHQLRSHFRHLGCPIVSDPIYTVTSVNQYPTSLKYPVSQERALETMIETLSPLASDDLSSNVRCVPLDCDVWGQEIIMDGCPTCHLMMKERECRRDYVKSIFRYSEKDMSGYDDPHYVIPPSLIPIPSLIPDNKGLLHVPKERRDWFIHQKICLHAYSYSICNNHGDEQYMFITDPPSWILDVDGITKDLIENCARIVRKSIKN